MLIIYSNTDISPFFQTNYKIIEGKNISYLVNGALVVEVETKFKGATITYFSSLSFTNTISTAYENEVFELQYATPGQAYLPDRAQLGYYTTSRVFPLSH